MHGKLHKLLSFNDVLLIGALLMAAGLVWNTIGAMQRNYRLQQKHDELSAEVELLELQNQNLRFNIAYLETDDYLEIAARDKFSKSLPGETMVYLPGNTDTKTAPVAKRTVQEREVRASGWRGNVQAWADFLRGGPR